jgi:hypothetical protein
MNSENAVFIGMLVLFAILIIPAVDTVVGWVSGGRRRRVQVEAEYAREDHDHADLASADHAHADYIKRSDIDACKTACAAQTLSINQSFSAGIEKIERQLDHLRDGVNSRLDAFGEANEQRVSKIHARVDVTEKVVAAVHARVEDHLQDHRAAKGTV